ncbi:GDSL-type esterase/lipase family protein [Streptomyces rectiverticillatus]|uniref:GDSL-type esterase/lipase family protein n=1 Tax=Streptomyces rectiverticillatus TaxID=173860 RepID=UPI0015C3D1BA|nr:GDSL-type esterase/lipase family protein [Streptomyces rectiverticillatus]
MGDSYISGEAGRWWANAAGAGADINGDRWGTDRAAEGCDNEGRNCTGRDERKIYRSSRDLRKGMDSGSCHRSDIAEIESVGINAHAENLACSGAKTLDILERRRHGEPPQIDELTKLAKDKSRQIKLIQVSIGGNDLGFSGVIKSCFFAYEFFKTHACQEKIPDLDAALKDVEPKITNTLVKIRKVMENAGYRESGYRLGIQSYPSPLAPGKENRYGAENLWKGKRWDPGGCPFYNWDADWSRDELVPKIAKMIREAAKAAKVVDFLDLQHAFDGHEVCRKGVHQSTAARSLKSPLPAVQAEWVRYLGFGLEQGSLQESLHPNAYGQMALANCLTRVYKLAPGAYECKGEQAGGPGDMKVTPLQ